MAILLRQLAPNFTTTDVYGTNISLSGFKGKKVLLTFYRNVGCPICNLRFHELQKQAGFFKDNGLVVLAIYESTAENMKQYLEGETFYAIMIPNSDQSLYQLYNIERSMGKLLKGIFKGGFAKMGEGKKLFKRKITQDGNTDRICADFLVDESGKIQTAYYGKYLGDHLPVDDIKQFLRL